MEEYLAKKRVQLGLDREDVLAQIQSTVDGWYPGQVRVRQLHQGVLRLVTPHASVASELRMRQLELASLHGLEGVRMAISIASLS